MPIVCIERPNRTKRRVYRCSDVGRITRYALKEGADKSCVFNSVIDELQYKETLCKILKVIRLVREIKDNAVYIAVLSALITIISGISSILRRRDRAQTLNLIVRNPITRRLTSIWDAITRLLDKTPIGQVLVGLGTLQLLLIAVRDLIDIWDDFIDPFIDSVVCEDEK